MKKLWKLLPWNRSGYRQHKEIKYYQDLYDLPVWNWFQLHQTGELKYLAVNFKDFEGVTLEANEVYHRIYQHYFDTFGQPLEYQDNLKQEKRLALLMTEYLIKKDRFLLTEIEILKHRLKADPSIVPDYNKQWAYYCSKVSHGVDIKETTVYNFISTLNLFIEWPNKSEIQT